MNKESWFDSLQKKVFSSPHHHDGPPSSIYTSFFPLVKLQERDVKRSTTAENMNRQNYTSTRSHFLMLWRIINR